MERKARLLRKLALEFKFRKSSDTTIIISVNENMQIPNNSTAKKVNTIRDHDPVRVETHINSAYICLWKKGSFDHAEQ